MIYTESDLNQFIIFEGKDYLGVGTYYGETKKSKLIEN